MKKILLLIITFFCLFEISAQNSDLDIKKAFIAGSMSEKLTLLKNAGTTLQDSSFYIEALTFANKYGALFSDDIIMQELVSVAVLNSTEIEKSISIPILHNIFKTFKDINVRISILKTLAIIGKNDINTEILVNAYAQEIISTYTEQQNFLLEIVIETLKQLENESSFKILFKCAATDIFPENIRKNSISALNLLNENYQKNMTDIITNSTNNTEKLLAFRIVRDNVKNSDFLRAEIAEKALSESIKNSETSNNSTDPKLILLQLETIRELYRVSWTRSAPLIVKLFNTARTEFANKELSEDEFIEIMDCLVKLASREAGKPVSDYLGYLNTETEAGRPCSKSLVLAVISALSSLGDKVAFDNLLYVGYVQYSDDVIEAARAALASLKW